MNHSIPISPAWALKTTTTRSTGGFALMQRYSDILEEWQAYVKASKPCTPPHSSGTRLEQAISRASYSREFIAVRRLPTGWQRLESSRGLGSRREGKLRNLMTVGSKRAWNKVLMDRHRMRMTHASRKVLEECGVINGVEYVDVEGSGVGGEISNIVSIARGVVLGKYGPDFGLMSSSSSSSCDGFFMIDIYRLVHNWVEVKGLLPHVGILTRVESFGRDNVLLSLLARLGSGLVCVSSGDLASILNRNNNSGTVGRQEIHDLHCCRPETHLKELSKCLMINSVGGKKKSSSECYIATVSVDSCDEVRRLNRALMADHQNVVVRLYTPSTESFQKGAGEPWQGRQAVLWGMKEDELPKLIDEIKRAGYLLSGFSVDVAGAFAVDCEGNEYTSIILQRLEEDFSFLEKAWRTAISLGVNCSTVRCIQILGATSDLTSLELIGQVMEGSPLRSEFGVKLYVDATNYLSSGISSAVTSVVGYRRGISNCEPAKDTNDDGGFMYYVDDGCYGGLSHVVLENAGSRRSRETTCNALFSCNADADDTIAARQLRPCIVWGPTCDALDCVIRVAMLPELHTGDFIVLENTGLEGLSYSTQFNGLHPLKKVFCLRQGLQLYGDDTFGYL